MSARFGASKTMAARTSRIRPQIPITVISPRTASIIHYHQHDHNTQSDYRLGGTSGNLD